jgi:hypothetical protein
MKSLEKYVHTRNYGCRIREYIYNGLKTVHMENDLIKVGILADKGADIYEFVYKPKDLDFMWHSFKGVIDPRSVVASSEHPGGGFLDCYEGGWQELFPSISLPCEYKSATLGIHGEVAMPSWEYKVITDEIDEISILFWVRTTRMPFLLERKMVLRIGDPTLYLSEKVTNEGTSELDFMWGHHPACGPVFLDDSCEILIDEGAISNVTFDWKGRRVAETEHSWPNLKMGNGDDLDISKVMEPDAGLIMTLGISNFKKARYEIKNNRKHISFGMQWEKEVFPHIWMWGVYGGGQEYPWFGRAYTLALEPWSSIPGDLNIAIENGETINIGAGQTISTELIAYAKSDEAKEDL